MKIIMLISTVNKNRALNKMFLFLSRLAYRRYCMSISLVSSRDSELIDTLLVLLPSFGAFSSISIFMLDDFDFFGEALAEFAEFPDIWDSLNNMGEFPNLALIALGDLPKALILLNE